MQKSAEYQLRDAFDAPRCCEKWLIFDQEGKFAAAGAYDGGDALSELRAISDKKEVYSPQLLLEVLRRLADQGGLGEIHSAKSQLRARTDIVVMFSSVCTGCATGTLVDLLNSHAKQDSDYFYLALVPNTFSKIDVQNLKVNLGLSFPVRPANSELSREWLSLNQQYGEKNVNGSVIALRDDKLIAVANSLEETRALLDRLKSTDQ